MDGRVRAPAASAAPKATFSQRVEWLGIDFADVERLLRAAVRILHSHGWTQKEGAKSAAGARVRATDPSAAFFSVNGALMRAESDLSLEWMHTVAAGLAFSEAVGMPA